MIQKLRAWVRWRLAGGHRYICSWCGARFGRAGCANSHGVCPACKASVLAEAECAAILAPGLYLDENVDDNKVFCARCGQTEDLAHAVGRWDWCAGKTVCEKCAEERNKREN